MTRSVVTGAAGFIGSTLSDRLLAEGHDVVGVDCFSDYYQRATKERNIAQARQQDRFRLIEQDLLEIDLPALLDGVDYVFHVAGQAGVRPSWGKDFAVYIRDNIAATQHLLEAANDASLKKFVFSSSSSVYGNAKQLPVTEEAVPQPVSPYGVTKLAAEHLCSLYGSVHGLPVASLRLFTVYGPRQRPEMAIQRFLTAAARDEQITVFGDGSQTRDFTFVDDVVQGHMLAMAAPEAERVFNICGGSRISLTDLITLIGNVTGRTIRIAHEDAAFGDARHTLGDNTRASKLLGFKPGTTLAEGVAAQWRWLCDQGG